MENQNLTVEQRLETFLKTLSITNRTTEYYVDWNKVESGVRKYEIELNTLNYLIGKSDIYGESLRLFTQQPNLLRVMPILIASRDNVLDILTFVEDEMSFSRLNFKDIDVGNIDEYVSFLEKVGVLNFLQNLANRSLVDYVYGVEVGLDSNARKNRSGKTMESLLEKYVGDVCEELGLEMQSQASARYIQEKWGIFVPVDKSERRFDLAVYSKARNKLWLLETNYYGGGGSKLKSVAGEFSNLVELIQQSEDDVEFVWVTDGKGWNTAKKPLSEAFNKIPNVFNLYMLEDGVLSKLFK